MNWILQSIAFAGIALICALATYLVNGEYDRSVPCIQSDLDEFEVCILTVLDDWEGKVLWIDARADEERLIKLPDALIITEANTKEQISSEKNLMTLFKAKGEGIKVVVFCQTDSCGSSKYVRKEILKSSAHDTVYYLHGGWKAIESNASLLK